MENKIVTAIFKDSTHTKVSDVWQYDYGQILRIQGLDLPTAVEVDFAVAGASESIARIGTTKDGVTDVVIPDSLIETGKNLVAYIYLRDSASGNTEYQIDMLVTKRAKPEAYDRPEDKELFGQAIEAVNTAADRAEKARQTAQEAAQKAGLDAEQTAQDRVEVAKMVETVTDISEQVKKVEELSNKAQESATQAGTSATAAEKAKAQAETAAGKTAEDRTAVNQAKIDVDEVQKAVRADRAAVEEAKQSVEQLSNAIPESTQVGVQAVNQAKQTAVDEIARTGISHKTAVEGAGTQAVENVENVKASATEAVETAKTEAVQSVQTEGNTQTGNVTTEGTKQVKAVQDKGNEVLQSIPEDFQMQMESKLDKQQGVENKGKALVIGEDGNVAPGEVQSGGGDGIAIINTMSGESPLVVPDSAERVNKRLELGGKTEQVQTTGAQLLPFPYVTGDMTKNGVTFAVQEDGGIKVTGTATEFVIFNIAKIDFGANSIFNNSEGNGKVLSGGKDNVKIEYNGLNKNTYLSIEKGLTVNTVIYPQLQNGTAATPYEPYTGGKPSPSPEYLQEIKNSGKRNEETRKYEVDVKITGKNLFDIEKAEVSGGNLCTAKRENNIVKITAIETVTSKRAYAIVSGGGICLKAGKTYFLNGRKVGTSNMTPMFAFFKEKNIGELLKIGNFYTPNEDICIDIGIYLVGNAIGTGDTLEITDIIVCEGKDAAQYQPYKEQTLTITSDRPITKWDRLVEQGGQIGWLYGGKIIDSYNSEQIDAEYMSSTGSLTVGATVLHKLKNAEFVPLPQSEQNAIRALKTYYPTTVITVDGGELDPDIKVTYTADTKNYIDNKVSAKVASIIRQYRLNTANLLSLMPMETQAAMIENDTNNILENAEEMKHE